MKQLTSAIAFILITINLSFFCFAEEFRGENYFYDETTAKNEDSFFVNPFDPDSFLPKFHPPSEPFKNEELYKINPHGSYDAKIKHKFDFNINDKKLEIVPKLRFKRVLEDKISRGKNDFQSESSVNVDSADSEKLVPSSVSASSSLTNSIYIGMDLSYAINKDIYIDSNLTFYQKDFEVRDKDHRTREVENRYRYEGNAMALSIGLRKKISDSFSAGLIYSWETWLNETENFKVAEPYSDETKASNDAQEALNLILRYDF
ncbi:MAG: hypothetical protein RBR53_07635 [Desulforegulaceae bacterium]|nr:hypothetical protein [Desulforegulaceae bacterium]